MTQPVTEDDLNGYIDGHLCPERRIAVEAYLQMHANEAADLMERMRIQNEIRVWLERTKTPPNPVTAALARRFGRIIGYRTLLPWLQRASVVVGLVLVGWIAHAVLMPPKIELEDSPEAVLADDAAQAWRVAQLSQPALARQGDELGVSADRQPEQPPLDVWPEGMRRVGSDKIGWDGGTAVIELMTTSHGEQLVLLKAATEASDSDDPALQVHEGVTTVAWRDDGYAYALTGDVSAGELLGLAHLIASRS